MMTDFDEKHDEHLVLLQQRNRILKQLKRKDPIQIRLEQLEQGFTLYVNGAHSESNNHHKKVTSQNISRRGTRTAKGNYASANTLLKKDVQGRGTQSAPSKIQRREWLQKAVQIKTESGARLHIAPPSEYSEDFEPYESLDEQAKNCEQNGPVQSLSSPESAVSDDVILSGPKTELCMSNDAEKGRLHLSLEDVKELHQSLEFIAGQNRMEEDCSEGEDTDSVEEDVPAEPSETEDTTEPSRQSTETSFCSPYPLASGRCCSIASGSLVTLEFKPSCPNLKKERTLSAKRKGSTEAFIPIKPVSQVAHPFSAECQRQEGQEIGLSSE
ncbi:hypothetical protein JD844_020150 [Phrynosoma platyrhinos]|uniref:Uncharacterized protein n=1 Tax=Phrynosoma platyrhinos TaxID=52577 RepID=A0ABQ7TRQ1_PHRPL|nr:hypothetical protein JD844_020150 [Phrynosoma platyrhinos]